MLDFDGSVKGHIGKFMMHGLDNAYSMCGTIPEVWVAKGNMACSLSYLCANICKHDIYGDCEEASAIYRCNRAVQASMFAAPCSFGIASQFEFIAPLQTCIA